MKDSSSCNSNDIITPIQISQNFFNNNTPDTVSKKGSEIKQLEESTNVIHSGEAFEGYNLFQFRDFSNGRYLFRITDMDGNIIDEFPSRNMYGHCYPINSTTFLSADSGIKFWNIETGRNQSFNFSSHHDVSYNPKTKTFITLTNLYVIYSGNTYRYDQIREMNRNGEMIWSLNTSSFIPYDWWTGETTGVNRDITHSNSVFWDIEEDMIYLNCRNLNTFYKIDHSNGQVVWGLGKHGNFTLYDRFGNQRQNLFYYAHALEKVDDDTFILFDNRWHNETVSTRSRILEITIDENSMTANESWVWTGPSNYYSLAWSDADRLPNGNRFGAFGYSPSPRLVEVNESGDIVWEMHYTGGSSGIYSADRFRLSPTLSTPDDKLIVNGDPIAISWQAWYNFRTKLKMNGTYVLYQDGNAINEGEVVFDKFWRPTNLTFNFNSLGLGEHNLTLVVMDEGGHTTKDTVNVTVRNFFVYREGPSQIELGEENGIIQWTGASISPLMGEIYDNNTFLNTFTWDGSKIELYLNSLTPGKHNITFQIYNVSEGLCYNDIFWVTIYPASSPDIFSFPQNQTMSWDKYCNLSWEIFDNSPKNWTLLINNSISQFEKWDQSHFQINHRFEPVFEIAVHNITLILTDQLGYQTTVTTWLTIIAPTESIIISTPGDTIQWGQKNTVLEWKVYGGIEWTLWRNNTLLRSGKVTENYIKVMIEKWQYEDWRIGTYNLTLRLNDGEGASTTSTTWILIKLNLGDAYANSVVNQATQFTLYPDNTLGPPDDIFSIVFEDYTYGYITLDMGINEEIINGDGPDFSVIAQGGEYSVSVSNDFTQSFSPSGLGTGNQTFDLGAGVTSARYVRIKCFSGDSINLDAIVALKSNSDLESPSIDGPDELWVWPDQTIATITWKISDHTPWNYSIFVNDLMVESGPWNGSDIIFTFSLPAIIETQVSLILCDIFGHRAKASVVIKVYEINVIGSSSTSTRANYPMIGLILGLGIIIALRKNRKRS